MNGATPPDRRIRGVVYTDRAVKYDIDENPLTLLGNVGASDNIYTYMPSALFDYTTATGKDSGDEGGMPAAEPMPTFRDDPTLKAAMADVEDYLMTTFWCNINGWRACLAAAALARRGLNILHAFYHARSWWGGAVTPN